MKKISFILILICNLITCCYSAESKKLVVLLDWFANPNHAPLFVAQQQGYFKEQGLEVELIGPADPSDPPKLVAAGKADIAVTYEPQFMEQVDEGLPLVRIGTLIDRPLSCLVTLKESGISKIEDLKNKTVGYSGSLASMSLKVMLKNHGLQNNDVHIINVHYDLTQALLSKKIDAVTGMMRNFELIQLELNGHPGQAFFPEKNGIPSYSELIYVANKNKIQDPRFKQFLAAVHKGQIYLQNHPESTWHDFAASHPEMNNELGKRSWQMTLPYFAKNPAEYDAKSWLHFAQFMQQNGLIKKVQPLKNYTVDLTKG